MNDLNKLLFTHPAFFISFGFGSGLSKFAPGTVGTLWSWAIFLVLENFFNLDYFLLLLPFIFFISIWACNITIKKLKKDDPSEIVIDEIVAFWLILSLLPASSDPYAVDVLNGLPEWVVQLSAFVIFRFLDIVKPNPIGFLEKKIKGGFGVMFDDIIAAVMTLLIISIFFKIFNYV